MSLRCMVQVLERYPTDCAPGEKLLALCLADNANEHGERIYPSVPTMARRSLQSERTVQRQLGYMQTMNWLQLVKSARGRGNPAHYRINAEWLAGKDDTLSPIQRTAKGDSATPFSTRKGDNGDTKRVTTATEKGDNGDSTYRTLLNLSENHTPLPPAERGEQTFAALVQAYPIRRADGKRAAVVWEKLQPSDELGSAIVQAAKALAQTEEWRRLDGQYAPKLSKWLRNEGWKQAPQRVEVAAVPVREREPEPTEEERARSRAIAKEAIQRARAMMGMRARGDA